MQDLNPFMKITPHIKQFVEQMLLDISSHQTSATIDKIDLQKDLEGGDFMFSINLLPSSKNFYEKQIDFIFVTFFELNRRYNVLSDLVKKKDLEIEEYKAQNVQLIKSKLLSVIYMLVYSKDSSCFRKIPNTALQR